MGVGKKNHSYAVKSKFKWLELCSAEMEIWCAFQSQTQIELARNIKCIINVEASLILVFDLYVFNIV